MKYLIYLLFITFLEFLCLNSVYSQEKKDYSLFENITEKDSVILSQNQNEKYYRIMDRSSTNDIEFLKIKNRNLELPDTIKIFYSYKEFKFLKTSIHIKPDGKIIWNGNAKNNTNATFVFHGNKITGSIISGLEKYKIEPIGGGIHVIYKFNESMLPSEYEEHKVDSTKLYPKVSKSNHNILNKTNTDPIIVNVLVAYTPAAEEQSGDIEGLIETAISESNTAYGLSGIDVSLNLVFSTELQYTEDLSIDNDLNYFTSSSTIQDYRDFYCADICVLLVFRNPRDFCGKAAGILPGESDAYCVVDYDCATGHFSFGHEIGHIQGAMHQWACNKVSPDYAHGYVYNNGSWYTMMAIHDPNPFGCSYIPNYTRIQYFSNPNISYQGTPTGQNQYADNARRLNETASEVSDYRTTTTLSGNLSEDERWYGEKTLTGTVYTSGSTLTIKSNAVLDLGSYSIVNTSGGEIVVESGAQINGAIIKSGSTILSIRPTIQSAVNNASSGNVIELQNMTYSESVTLTSKNNIDIVGNGPGNSIINGNVSLNSSSYIDLSDFQISNYHKLSLSGCSNTTTSNLQIDNNGQEAFSVYNSTGNNLRINASNTEDVASYINNSNGSFSYSNMENHGTALYLSNNSSFYIYSNSFCDNSYDIDAESGAIAYSVNNVYSDYPSSYLGNVTVSGTTTSCAVPKRNSVPENDFITENSESSDKFFSADSVFLFMQEEIYRDIKANGTFEKNKFENDLNQVIAGFKEYMNNYPVSIFSETATAVIILCYRQFGDYEKLRLFIEEINNNSKFEHLKNFAKKYLIDYYINDMNYTNALSVSEEILKETEDEDLICSLLYEKGMIHQYYLNDPEVAISNYKQICQNYFSNPMVHFAVFQMEMLNEKIELPQELFTTATTELNANNYPNPFNPTTTISYTLPTDGRVTIKVFDMLGREVKTLVNDYKNAGGYSTMWDSKDSFGNEVSSGIYFYNIKFMDNSITKKMVLVR